MFDPWRIVIDKGDSLISIRSWTLEDINPDQGALHNPNLG
jgi:hypothetical protein